MTATQYQAYSPSTATSASGLDALDRHHYWGTPQYTTVTFED